MRAPNTSGKGKGGIWKAPLLLARAGLQNNRASAYFQRMDAEDLLQTMHRKEFRPVELHLSDGQKMLVPHPDYFLVFPNRKSALVFPDGIHFEILDLASIVRAGPVETRPA